jgi:cytochrome c biogenesis factor
MMFAGVVGFSVGVIAIALGVFKRYEAFEKAEMSAYMALVAWGSLLFGLFISKI